jgi:hypothetical protein
MMTTVLERIRASLLERRAGLAEWLQTTPQRRKGMLLGPSSEQAVHARLDAIEDSIAKAEARTLGRCDVCDGYVETDLLEADYTACVCLTHYSGERLRQLENELELAQTLQRSLLPCTYPMSRDWRSRPTAGPPRSSEATTSMSSTCRMASIAWPSPTSPGMECRRA